MSEAVEVAAGGMHTVVLDSKGQVWTFGCNDEGSLGRLVEEEEDCFLPAPVTIPEPVVQISAGDSHRWAEERGKYLFRNVKILCPLQRRADGDWRGVGVGNLPRQQRPHRPGRLGPAGEGARTAEARGAAGRGQRRQGKNIW